MPDNVKALARLLDGEQMNLPREGALDPKDGKRILEYSGLIHCSATCSPYFLLKLPHQTVETIALSQDLVVTPPDLNDMEEWYLIHPAS